MVSLASKPLVALLNGNDCSVECSILKDVAEVAFCDAKCAKDLHDRVFNEAFAVLLWYDMILTEDDLKRFKALRLIVHIGAGYDNVDVKAAGELGIAVCDVPGCDVEETADSTMSLILNLFRKTYWLANMVREGKKLDRPEKVAVGCVPIRGKTLGIIGFGRVGIAVGFRAKAFGFNVIFYDPYRVDNYEKSYGFQRVHDLYDLLHSSDCISLNCNLHIWNINLINKNTIKEMRVGVYLVNTARGGLVNEEDVAYALKTGHIGAAALDVHELEPSNALEGPLKYAPNLICTPHAAWCSSDSYNELHVMAAHEILRAISGDIPNSLRNCVNKEFLITRD